MSGPQTVYRFEGFELDPGERRLKGPEGPVVLTPKVFDTLVLLVERAGRVVTKEEILQAIWPRGYIDESNLTKHIWLIRRALREGQSAPRFIETVPKRGYRFVAAVATLTPEAVASPAPVQSNSAAGRPAGATQRHRQVGLLLALLSCIVVVAVAVWLWPRATSRATHQGHTVALIGFNNLSRNPKDAWIGPALTEMLAAEVNVTADVHALPDELVRDVAADLSAPGVSGYSRPTLRRVSQRLDADYVLGGSYLVSNASVDSPLRIELSVQDAHTGTLLAAPSFQSNLSQLTAVVSEAGALLRGKLSHSALDPHTLALVANAQPPTIEVARRVGFALDALRHYDAARARDELLEAVAQAPGYPLAYTHLAQAWTALGYHDKAVAAAEQAARYAVHLPPEQQLQTEITLAHAHADWTHALENCQSLIQLKPLNPEYRLQCIETQVDASRADEAAQAIAALRNLPAAANDPRVELAAARVARALDDVHGEAVHASAALTRAQSHEAPGLEADAQLELSRAQERLGQLRESRASLESAARQYHAIRNPHGEAQARLALGGLSWTEHHAQAAREQYQAAMALYQSIGDQSGIASVYREICDMLWDAGDRDGAQTAAREALQRAREIGDLHLQAWTLRALATIASDEAASDEVVKNYREVLELTQRSGDRGGHVWSLAALADIERLRGALEVAQASCAQAKQESAVLSDRQFAIYSGFTCALVAIDRGDIQSARAQLNDVMQQATATKYPVYADNARMSLALLDMDEHQWRAARDKLRGASSGFAADEVQTGEADALAMLALCERALGNRVQEEDAAGRARKLREAITSRQEVYLVDIVLARLEHNSAGAQVDQLLKLAVDAERRQFVAWALEARLAAWEALHAQGAEAAADRLRAQLETQAQRAGFGRILQRLHATT